MSLWKNPFKRSAALTPDPVTAEVTPPARRHRRGNSARQLFAAAKTDRFTTAWPTQPMSADEIIEKYQRVLVARSREQATNNNYAKKFLRLCVNNIVGPRGVMLQAKSRDGRGKLDTAANTAIELAFAAWGHRDHCDITGRKTWRAIQAACINSVAKDGEFFARIIYGPDAGKWGISLQMIDPQRCPVDLKQDRLSHGGFIRQGIEFNRYGRPLAYFFSTLDASETSYRWGGCDYVRVPASEILHGFLEEMTGQKRGVPWMGVSLREMRHLNEMEVAALINSRAGASKMGFIEWDEDTGPDADDPEEFYVDANPGEFQILPTGAHLKEWNPQYPNGEFAGFAKHSLRGMASGTGVTYNTLANDLEGVNFSSIRQGTLDERENWKELQEWFIECLHRPVYEAWLPRALLLASIKVKNTPLRPERLERYSIVEWQARRWAWIDPSADATAAEKAKNNMLQAPGQIIRESGRDPDTVWRESASDVRRMIDSYIEQGVTLETAEKLVLQSMGLKDAPPAGGFNSGNNNEQKKEDDKTTE